MRLAETVCLGGGALDRAANLRARLDAGTLSMEGASVLPIWRGMPLSGPGGLVWLDPSHGGLPERRGLLGLADCPRLWTDLDGDEAPDLGQGAFAPFREVMTGLDPREAELASTAMCLSNWHRTHRFCSRCGQPSEVADAGWRRHCPSCGAQHFPRTDPVVIMLIERREHVLLGRSPAWPERMYSLLAGFVEPGETVEAAVRREVLEESGVRVGRVDYLASQPWPFPNSLMIGCRGRAESEEITLDPVELEDALWVGKRDLMRVVAGTHPDIAAPREGAIAGFLLRHWLADRLD